MNQTFWRNRRVFVTGHTGFKGGWLSLWLQQLGARVHGYALPPPTDPNLFTVAAVARGMASSEFGDIRDASQVKRTLAAAEPEIVFHLAAQPLVRHSYAQPVETYAVNVMGTVNVLEAARDAGPKAVVNITSDKCYENREWPWAYRENDCLGGNDPYSNSKACAELVTSCYRKAFLHGKGIALASARAGNVIGGGDWATDRLIPDAFRALDRRQVLRVRSPDAIRPWQHVLEPLAGYLMLAESLCKDPDTFAQGWNFGPLDEDVQPVRWILERLKDHFHDLSWETSGDSSAPEARVLKLDSSKARSELKWRPRWRLNQALAKTVEWQKAWSGGRDMTAETLRQISEYQALLCPS